MRLSRQPVAHAVTTAFYAQAGAVMIRSPSLEKRDASYQGREPVRVIDAVSRYKPWARHWSQRARFGDRTVEIMIAAIIDERAFHIIEADAGIRHGMAARVTIAGLRDYAARAGWADRNTGNIWIGGGGSDICTPQVPRHMKADETVRAISWHISIRFTLTHFELDNGANI